MRHIFAGGLPGVWRALSLLSVARLGTLLWRYQHPIGPLPPLLPSRRTGDADQPQPPGVSAPQLSGSSGAPDESPDVRTPPAVRAPKAGDREPAE